MASKAEKTVTGWKCFDKDLKCRDVQFKVGGSYSLKGELKLCVNGFHFHENGWELFNYYSNVPETRVCEVVAHEVVSEGDKSCCRKIEVVRELTYQEICQVFSQENGDGNGYGDGDGNGNGDGDGYGNGYGYGDGDGYGYGNGYGYGDGDGDGNGYGYGYGYGYGNGYGDGDGNGYGDGYGDGNGYGKFYQKLAA